MMKTIQVSDRDRKMLELLALGESSKGIAKKLGYRAGTMRVYLHELYRKLKVPNKTAAVVWYFDNMRAPQPQPAPEAADAGGLSLEEGVGELALRTDLFTAMGSMSLFIGPYGKVWQVAARLKGTSLDAAGEARSRDARRLWEAYLRGDFAYAKRRYDDGDALRVDAVPEGLLLAAMLATAGYSNAAARTTGELTRARREAPASAAEHEFLTTLREASDSGAHESLAGLHRIAGKSTAEPLRHLALVALHHLHRTRGEAEQAKHAAEILWIEAETSQQNLQAMGERPLYREASLVLPAAGTQKVATGRRKEASTAR